MTGQLAENFYDRLLEAIRAERPVKLVYIGREANAINLLSMWENGTLLL